MLFKVLATCAVLVSAVDAAGRPHTAVVSAKLQSLAADIKHLTPAKDALEQQHVTFQTKCHKEAARYKKKAQEQRSLIQKLDTQIGSKDITIPAKGDMGRAAARTQAEIGDNEAKLKASTAEHAKFAQKSATSWKAYRSKIKAFVSQNPKILKSSKKLAGSLGVVRNVVHSELSSDYQNMAAKHFRDNLAFQKAQLCDLKLLLENQKANLATTAEDKALAALRVQRAEVQVKLQQFSALGESTQSDCLEEMSDFEGRKKANQELEKNVKALMKHAH
mmetsp:Transcript_11337/g.21574  ORF Transcript_11337/g.21574 Transcript_11337/m.21574 type:complete len:276 (-) Transcript_11337:96-923(-)|eukprot:CAMPEP_0175161150 /NCGR_PEP_ID=MMETSP0087-20121206/24441_1 /TAXON_ID=136419 /ORGANISM="Unknown Unknown, Strain D1" /LENGTH=275 /DNA_ID=CAMNT_0016449525 /DNA_START=42 /DNA_END=869 /DNA_ORIENTATION=+